MIQSRATGAQIYSLRQCKISLQLMEIGPHGLSTSFVLLRPWLPGLGISIAEDGEDISHFTNPQHSAVQCESFLCRVETCSIFLIRLRRLEHSLVHIRVELLATRAWVESV